MTLAKVISICCLDDRQPSFLTVRKIAALTRTSLCTMETGFLVTFSLLLQTGLSLFLHSPVTLGKCSWKWLNPRYVVNSVQPSLNDNDVLISLTLSLSSGLSTSVQAASAGAKVLSGFFCFPHPLSFLGFPLLPPLLLYRTSFLFFLPPLMDFWGLLQYVFGLGVCCEGVAAWKKFSPSSVWAAAAPRRSPFELSRDLQRKCFLQKVRGYKEETHFMVTTFDRHIATWKSWLNS